MPEPDNEGEMRFRESVPHLDKTLKGRIVAEGARSAPIQFAATRSTRRYYGACSSCTLPEDMPLGSFLRFDRGLYISNPALTFCELAFDAGISLMRLVLMGMELCGTYTVGNEMFDRTLPMSTTAVASESRANSPVPRQAQIVVSRKKLADKQQMANWIDYLARNEPTARARKGISKAKSALALMAEDSNSPMESALYLALCLPSRLGGKRLPPPKLNDQVQLSDDGARFVGRNVLRGDLVWKDHGLIVEYQSRQEHDSEQGFTMDARRKHAFEASGFKVIEAYYEDVADPGRLDLLHSMICKHLGLHARMRQQGYEQRRLALLDQILPKPRQANEI